MHVIIVHSVESTILFCFSLSEGVYKNLKSIFELLMGMFKMSKEI